MDVCLRHLNICEINTKHFISWLINDYTSKPGNYVLKDCGDVIFFKHKLSVVLALSSENISKSEHVTAISEVITNYFII